MIFQYIIYIKVYKRTVQVAETVDEEVGLLL